ncbi:MAG: hemerythrin domain-containing protein [Alphaproteobacteria bacterium]
MMEYSSSIARMLHDEHMATIALLERIETTLAGHRKAAPDTASSEISGLLGDLITAVDSDITNHFAFEEAHLFTRLREAGDTGMTQILQGEHDVILPLGKQIREIAQGALTGGFDADSWDNFRRMAAELVERMISHIQKEEMGMLPMLEDLLDGDADMEVSSLYAEMR